MTGCQWLLLSETVASSLTAVRWDCPLIPTSLSSLVVELETKLQPTSTGNTFTSILSLRCQVGIPEILSFKCFVNGLFPRYSQLNYEDCPTGAGPQNHVRLQFTCLMAVALFYSVFESGAGADGKAGPIAVEPCAGSCAAVQTLLMSLPRGSSAMPPPGQCGITIASALVDSCQQRAGDFKGKGSGLKSRKQQHTMHQGTCV
ncbi:putative attractin-like protein 1 [Triplophysa rosa]|uniref:Attractin-like protein 1 n=1 Tax=Triplophysa rosa TaxID=992332 RepID=A0A9W7WNK5_TRIRA|nr:putative attractin-like protein 1 [Triplophysa rosa]